MDSILLCKMTSTLCWLNHNGCDVITDCYRLLVTMFSQQILIVCAEIIQ